MSFLKKIFARIAKREGTGPQVQNSGGSTPPPRSKKALEDYCRAASMDHPEEDEKKSLTVLVEGVLSFELNMSDTFDFACADSEPMDADHYRLLVPLIAKYGHHALTAYVAVKRGMEPITCKCCHNGLDYQEAKREILQLKEKFEGYFL